MVWAQPEEEHKDEADSHFLFAVHSCSEPVQSLWHTHYPWQAFQTSVTSSVCLLGITEVETTKCVFALPWRVCLPHLCVSCPTASRMLVVNPSLLVVGLPRGCSSVWGIHECHEYSGKTPELGPLTYIYKKKKLYPTVDMGY